MDWRQIVKVLAVATQILTVGWFLIILGERGINEDAAVSLSVCTLSILVLILNLAKSLLSADPELSTLKQELEKAELRLKLHRLNVHSREET